jgi:hypothetical protein
MAMTDLDQLGWEILNTTADDSENLEQIYRMLCQVQHCQPLKGSCLLNEIADRIRDLVRGGLLTVEMDESGLPWKDQNDVSFVWRAWFRMTPLGEQLWKSSQHFVGQE